MEPIDPTVIILVLGVFLGSIGGVLGLKWLSLQANTPERARELIERKKEEVDELKKEVNYWRGKASKNKQALQVDGNYDLDDDNDLVSLAKSIMPGIVDLLPKDAQKHVSTLLSNPDFLPLLGEIYEKFPKESKQLLSGFLKNTKSSSGQEAESSTNQKALFDAGGA